MSKKMIVIISCWVAGISFAADHRPGHERKYDPTQTAALAEYLKKDTVRKEIVKQFLESKADPNVETVHGPLLLRAIIGPSVRGHCNDFVRYLLECGADSNRTYAGNPLFLSASDAEDVALMIEHNANLDWNGPNGRGVLHYRASILKTA